MVVAFQHGARVGDRHNAWAPPTPPGMTRESKLGHPWTVVAEAVAVTDALVVGLSVVRAVGEGLAVPVTVRDAVACALGDADCDAVTDTLAVCVTVVVLDADAVSVCVDDRVCDGVAVPLLVTVTVPLPLAVVLLLHDAV